MVARTVDSVAFPPEPMSVENNDMMAGSDIYRRVQTRKKSSMGYIVPAVVVIALGAGAAIYAMQPTNHPAASAPLAVASEQQANASAQQAATSATTADTSAKTAIASSEQAQANKVAVTGNPPSAVTDTQPVKAPVVAHHADRSPTLRTAERAPIRVRPDRAPSAGASGVDVNALTPPPAPVMATPVTPAPAIPSAPAPTVQPQTAAPDQSATPVVTQP